MSKEIQIFKNDEFGQVRTLTIKNEPYFVGKDVAEVLGYAKPQNAIATHVDEDDTLKQGIIDNLGRMQQTTVINESGLYSLILSSKLPNAKKFKKWVTSEVLPQIRKTGSYTNNQNSINEFKGQLATMINDMFEDKLKEVKEYYKINSKSKFDLSSYIKKRLGINRADDEYEQVKTRVFLILGISKWEDLNVDSYKEVLPIIDESIRIIKLDRPQQMIMWG